jgi:5,5'-dehydrodivanillate O-demethylase
LQLGRVRCIHLERIAAAGETTLLKPEENERITRVGPGTPGGELLRRYWHPVAAAGELTPEQPRKRVKILGEELVLYRTDSGHYGLLAEHCSHRGTSLYYGFVEGECLRCPYHGWRYDPTGRCIEQPFEPAQSLMKHTLRHPAYPVEELGGLLFAYLGPPEKQPLLPNWDLVVEDRGPKQVTFQPLSCNWLQAMENSADVTHTYFLHGRTMISRGQEAYGRQYTRPFARYGFQPFPWGLLKSWEYEGKRATSGWGNLLVFPNMLRIFGAMHWRVPLDDTHTVLVILDARNQGTGKVLDGPANLTVMPADTWTNEQGEYHMNTFPCQDGMAWETQGTIFDRSHEHLGASDTGIAMLRQMLLEQITIAEQGGNPMALVYDPAENLVIDLESWENESDRHFSSTQAADDPRSRAAAAVFDARHTEFEVPFGSGRPRDS